MRSLFSATSYAVQPFAFLVLDTINEHILFYEAMNYKSTYSPNGVTAIDSHDSR